MILKGWRRSLTQGLNNSPIKIENSDQIATVLNSLFKLLENSPLGNAGNVRLLLKVMDKLAASGGDRDEIDFESEEVRFIIEFFDRITSMLPGALLRALNPTIEGWRDQLTNSNVT